MRERDIEKILTEEVKREGGRAYKWTSPGNAGVPVSYTHLTLPTTPYV